jgi:DNA-binding NarL/FixJ family response regulator
MSAYTKRFDLLLTAREKKVLKLIVEGQTNKEIAATLGIGPSTVRKHLHSILGKLDVKNRVQAAVYAVRMGDCPLEVEQDEDSEAQTEAAWVN